jgi:hypothetical protein
MRGAPDPPSFAWRPNPATFRVVPVFRPALDIVAGPPHVPVAVPMPMSRLPNHRSTRRRRDNFCARWRDRRVGRRWRRLSARAAYPDRADSRTDNKPLHRPSPNRSRPRCTTSTRNPKRLIVTARYDVKYPRSTCVSPSYPDALPPPGCAGPSSWHTSRPRLSLHCWDFLFDNPNTCVIEKSGQCIAATSYEPGASFRAST